MKTIKIIERTMMFIAICVVCYYVLMLIYWFSVGLVEHSIIPRELMEFLTLYGLPFVCLDVILFCVWFVAVIVFDLDE